MQLQESLSRSLEIIANGVDAIPPYCPPLASPAYAAFRQELHQLSNEIVYANFVALQLRKFETAKGLADRHHFICEWFGFVGEPTSLDPQTLTDKWEQMWQGALRLRNYCVFEREFV